MTTVAVLGAGSIGTALAQVAAENGHTVRIWSLEGEALEQIRDFRCNRRHLPELLVHERVEPVWEPGQALNNADLALLCVPSQAIRALARTVAPCVSPKTVVVNVAKGLEQGTHLRMSEVIAKEVGPQAAVASMGGPAIALDIVRHWPTAVIVAAEPISLAAEAQQALQNQHFKVETCSDLVGVELGATLKNVYAIALGICDGLGYGTNTKAFAATLAMEEMAPIIIGLGGKEGIPYSLAGMGDLITTGFSPHSRNRTLGEKLVTDPGWQEYAKRTTVEGIAGCLAAKGLADRQGMETPLMDVVYGVLFEEKPAAETLSRFLKRFLYPSSLS